MQFSKHLDLKMNNCIICIPIYKTTPQWNELISFNQCIKILYKHPICIVTHKSLNIDYFLRILEKTNLSYYVEYFDEFYFKNILGYNQLLLSKEFYTRFNQYTFLLIHQLDVYVFRDEVFYWCNQNYDYIGAPWFANYGTFENDDKLWAVGNGGFSLRKINTFIQILSFKFPIHKPYYIWKNLNYLKKEKLVFKFVLFFLECLGYRNNIHYLLLNNKINEDAFWTFTFRNSWVKFNTAPIDLAIRFSFEKSPSFLFLKNKNKLPFGCHAWEKYEYSSFWSKFIY
jgi:hypothetical protein